MNKGARRRLSKDELLNVLRELASELGHSPSKWDLAKLSKNNKAPSAEPFVNAFGSLVSAVKMAGLQPKPPHRGFSQFQRTRVLKPLKPPTVASCHPERQLLAKGLCKACYRRAHGGKSGGHSINKKQRFRILLRDGFRCVYCGRGPSNEVRLVVDHVTPVAKGGMTTDENLKTACVDCNIGKGAVLLEMEQMLR